MQDRFGCDLVVHRCRRMRLAVAIALATSAGLATAAPQDTQQQATAAADGAIELDRVIVTAAKREQSVREVPASVSAVTQQQLQDQGAQSLADYVQKTPGVVFNSYQPGVSHVVVRGISTSAGNPQGQPTTGYFLNDVPLIEPGWTIAIPDIDAFDLNRVEVLRGPQGSLFGSASMGGAINYIANLADASGFDAAVEAGVSSTRNADVGYTLKGMVNVPVKQDVFAIRAVAQQRSAPGYIDNLGTGVDGANDLSVSGGRLSMVLTPNEATTLTWLSLLQTIDSDDNAYRIPERGDLVRYTSTPEYTETDIELHSLRWDQDLGWGTLTALASRQEKSQDWRFDLTPYLDFYNADLGTDSAGPLFVNSGGESTGDSYELRLASADSDRFEWLVGAMVFDTEKHLYEQLGAPGFAALLDGSTDPRFGPGTGAVVSPDGDVFNAFYAKVTGKEQALFGEASIHLNPQWTLGVGGRAFKTRVRVVDTTAGVDVYPLPSVQTADDNTEESGFQPKVSLRYRPSDRFMIYALRSEGFRFGVPNNSSVTQHDIPAGSRSDSLVNHELGVRTDLAGGRLLLDATVFHIDWSDIQLRLQTPEPVVNYAGNGGKASSRGVELSAQWRPTAAFDWSSSVTWQQARLDEDVFILWYGTAPKGSRLPGSADWSIANQLNWRFDGAYAPTLMLSHTYLSEGISDLNSAVPGVAPNEQGDYHQFDARFRMSFGNTDVTLFGTNLADERGVTRTVPEAYGLGQGILRPRTFGVTVHWRY
jgi:iron complex outermembrane receptor protein